MSDLKLSGIGDLVSVFIGSGLVRTVGVPGGGVVVHMVLHVVLGIVDHFIVDHLGLRELEDDHGTCEKRNNGKMWLMKKKYFPGEHLNGDL